MITPKEVLEILNQLDGSTADKAVLIRAYDMHNEIYYFKNDAYGTGKRNYKDFARACGSSCNESVIMGLRHFLGITEHPSSFVGKYAYEDRINICKSCKYYKDNGLLMNSCGTIGVGEETEDGKTCGCFIVLKARLSTQHCPLNISKW